MDSEDGGSSDVAQRFQQAADEADDAFFSQTIPKRAPYRRGVKMCRGCDYFEKWKEFLVDGGIGAYKNAVVMNIRMNSIDHIDLIGESFRCDFFLDLAYWVPRFDVEHHGSPKTLDTFGEFEPHVTFPEAKAEIVGRTTEFSKDPTARQHECQLGQNAVTRLKVKGEEKAKGTGGDPLFAEPPRALRFWQAGDGLVAEKRVKSKTRVKRFAKVGDKSSHWPRLWRSLVSDKELEESQESPAKKKKKLEPSNEDPEAMHPRLKELLRFLDARRELNLAHPEEGIVYVTFNVALQMRQAYRLEMFPYDFQELGIQVATRCHTAKGCRAIATSLAVPFASGAAKQGQRRPHDSAHSSRGARQGILLLGEGARARGVGFHRQPRLGGGAWGGRRCGQRRRQRAARRQNFAVSQALVIRGR